MEETRILLDDNDFKELVSGKIVEKTRGNVSIKIILSDIGWYWMHKIIDNVESKANGKPRS
jgi:hypothetical protein